MYDSVTGCNTRGIPQGSGFVTLACIYIYMYIYIYMQDYKTVLYDTT